MTSQWQILCGNLAIVALFVLGWAHLRYWLSAISRSYRNLLLGVTMGLGAVVTMVMAVPLQPGVYGDLRISLLIVAAFFGGLPTALISTAIGVLYRVWVGGAGVYSGVLCIIVASATGLLMAWLLRGRQIKPRHLPALGVASGVLTLFITMTLPREVLVMALSTIAAPLIVLNFIATTLAGLVHLQAGKLASERDLLITALANAPDYAYVKDRHGQYTALNFATARLNGFAARDSMIGKTDFDFAPLEQAQAQFLVEERAMASGQPLIGVEEAVTHPDGKVSWFSTTSVPLHDRQGEVIGLAGVKRDITQERELQHELRQSRDTLSFALAEMSDGLAMFDSNGFLKFCNEQYRNSFPYTGAMRQPGVHFRAIVDAIKSSGEVVNLPDEGIEPWIDGFVPKQVSETEYEINLFDGRWLLARTRPASNGAIMVVVSDITRIKQSELELHSTANRLKALVLVDSLTGLLNRRAFDDAMEKEIRRSGRNATPLSLLLIDVDSFKRYNDHYGHPAGDAVLRNVSAVLKSSLKRPADLAARYGGEEFAAILPDTDEDGAYLVAEAFRRALGEANIPHLSSERGHLTASVGVATYMPDNVSRSAGELLQVADDALYSAKAAGRDRVFGKRVPAPGWRYANSPTTIN